MPLPVAIAALALHASVATTGASARLASPPAPPPRVEVAGIDSVMALDATQRGQVLVYDESGRRLAFPRLRWATSDSTIVAVDASGALYARGPGVATVTVATSGLAVARRVRVEGVAMYVNGERRTYGGDLEPSDRVVISNGRLRLRLGGTEHGQRAGTVAEVRAGEEWIPGTSHEYGDYTYVGSGVTTAPTRAIAIVVNPSVVTVRWVFGDHRFSPEQAGLSESFDEQPYPFEKQVWLRSGEDGYYARVRPYEVLPSLVDAAEHEIGFGGLWGPGTITTGSERREVVDATVSGRRIPTTGYVDAAEFARPGDILTRVLVPMSPSPLMVPRFSAERFGSVWIHRLRSEAYGAYLYMAIGGQSMSPREVCAHAFRNPPFALMAPPPPAELRVCGPAARL